MENVFKFTYKWSRPITLPFPHVWHRSEVKSPIGKRFNIRIEDLTPDRHDEVWNLFSRNYFGDEPVARSLGVSKDEASLASLEHEYRAVMKQNASLITVLDEPVTYPKLIGVHLKAVISKDEPLEQPPKKIISPGDKYNYVCLKFREGIDLFREFDCDTCFDDFGMFVVEEFRGLGIAEKMLDASRKYGIAFRIRGELVAIVNPSMRPVAGKFGFRILREVKLEDMKDMDGNPLISIDGIQSIYFGGVKFF